MLFSDERTVMSTFSSYSEVEWAREIGPYSGEIGELMCGLKIGSQYWFLVEDLDNSKDIVHGQEFRVIDRTMLTTSAAGNATSDSSNTDDTVFWGLSLTMVLIGTLAGTLILVTTIMCCCFYRHHRRPVKKMGPSLNTESTSNVLPSSVSFCKGNETIDGGQEVKVWWWRWERVKGKVKRVSRGRKVKFSSIGGGAALIDDVQQPLSSSRQSSSQALVEMGGYLDQIEDDELVFSNNPMVPDGDLEPGASKNSAQGKEEEMEEMDGPFAQAAKVAALAVAAAADAEEEERQDLSRLGARGSVIRSGRYQIPLSSNRISGRGWSGTRFPQARHSWRGSYLGWQGSLPPSLQSLEEDGQVLSAAIAAALASIKPSSTTMQALGNGDCSNPGRKSTFSNQLGFRSIAISTGMSDISLEGPLKGGYGSCAQQAVATGSTRTSQVNNQVQVPRSRPSSVGGGMMRETEGCLVTNEPLWWRGLNGENNRALAGIVGRGQITPNIDKRAWSNDDTLGEMEAQKKAVTTPVEDVRMLDTVGMTTLFHQQRLSSEMVRTHCKEQPSVCTWMTLPDPQELETGMIWPGGISGGNDLKDSAVAGTVALKDSTPMLASMEERASSLLEAGLELDVFARPKKLPSGVLEASKSPSPPSPAGMSPEGFTGDRGYSLGGVGQVSWHGYTPCVQGAKVVLKPEEPAEGYVGNREREETVSCSPQTPRTEEILTEARIEGLMADKANVAMSDVLGATKGLGRDMCLPEAVDEAELIRVAEVRKVTRGVEIAPAAMSGGESLQVTTAQEDDTKMSGGVNAPDEKTAEVAMPVSTLLRLGGDSGQGLVRDEAAGGVEVAGAVEGETLVAEFREKCSRESSDSYPSAELAGVPVCRVIEVGKR
ncbi:unnamed protein product [Choristocarpus tenellus]